MVKQSMRNRQLIKIIMDIHIIDGMYLKLQKLVELSANSPLINKTEIHRDCNNILTFNTNYINVHNIALPKHV